MTKTLDTACRRAFAQHETFHARYGWFRKAVTEAARNPNVFLAEDATVTLGVGKNMVRAIRFWGGAAKVLAEVPAPGKGRTKYVHPSHNGAAIFGDDGADPYLEAPGTLWLLHWLLLRPPCELPVWWIAFNRFSSLEFTDNDLVAFVTDEMVRVGWSLPNESSIRKDISCLLRTYATTDYGRASLDDLLDSPLRGLGLLERGGTATVRLGGYRFLLGSKPSLPAEIVGFAMLDWMQQNGSARTASMANASYEPGSPGKVLGLSEKSLNEALGQVAESYRFGQLTTTAGASRFAVASNDKYAKQSLADIAHGLLAGYYRGLRMKLTRCLGDDAADEPDNQSAFESTTTAEVSE